MDRIALTPDWEFVADTVMGGVSRGQIAAAPDGTRLTGQVSLENDGGFVQMAFDLADGDAHDASRWDGVWLDVTGNDERYDLRLRTTDLTRAWQSYRAAFVAPKEGARVRIAFADLEAHRTEAAFDPGRLRRIGVLAIGRVFAADVTVRGVGFYRD